MFCFLFSINDINKHPPEFFLNINRIEKNENWTKENDFARWILIERKFIKIFIYRNIISNENDFLAENFFHDAKNIGKIEDNDADMVMDFFCDSNETLTCCQICANTIVNQNYVWEMKILIIIFTLKVCLISLLPLKKYF